MVLAGIVLLAQAPLVLTPGFRTFPEIATLVGQSETEVRCDPKIAHRAAFVSAKAISREGLVRALRLIVVQEGERKVLKAQDAELEREWAGNFRRAMERRYARFFQMVVLAERAKARRPEGHIEDVPDLSFMAELPRSNTPSDEQSRAYDESLAESAWVAVEVGSGGSICSAISEFPSEIPPELVERGILIDVRPFTALSRGTLASLAKRFPMLRGGPESLLIRRRTFGRYEMKISIGIVDPAAIVAPIPIRTLLSNFASIGAFAPDEKAPSRGEPVKLRRFAPEIAARRSEEREGAALVDAYVAELPGSSNAPSVGLPYSLSNLVQKWAERGHDVIQELDPESEPLSGFFEGGRMLRNAYWSPTVVEGVLVLRPLARFMNGSRRFPYKALFAFEAAGETPENVTDRILFRPAPEASTRYVAFAGPADRWLTTPYRGWFAEYYELDHAAARKRVIDLVPASTLADSAHVLRESLAKPNPKPYTGANGQLRPGPVQVWTHRVSEFPSETQEAILAQMRASGDGSNILAFSPAASRRFLSEAFLEVRVHETYRGFVRSATIAAPGSQLFVDAGLYGE